MANRDERIKDAIDTCKHVSTLLPSFDVYMKDIIDLLKTEPKIEYEFKGGRYRPKRGAK